MQSDIPFDMVRDSGLTVISNQLSLGEIGVRRWLQLKNETGKTITRVLVLVTYLDFEGKPIFAIPYYGAPENSPVDMLMIHPFIKNVLNNPVKPGESFNLKGTNLLATRIPPARAEVTLIDMEFDDHTSKVTGAHTSLTNLMLLNTPQFFELDADPDKLPDQLLLSINVDVRGRVTSVEFKQPGKVSEAILAQIRSQVMLWSFFPATERDFAVPTELSLLFRFHDAGFPFPAPTCPLKMPDTLPRTFAEVDIQAAGNRRWEVQYGWEFGQYARGEFQTIEIHSSPAKVIKN